MPLRVASSDGLGRILRPLPTHWQECDAMLSDHVRGRLEPERLIHGSRVQARVDRDVLLPGMYWNPLCSMLPEGSSETSALTRPVDEQIEEVGVVTHGDEAKQRALCLAHVVAEALRGDVLLVCALGHRLPERRSSGRIFDKHGFETPNQLGDSRSVSRNRDANVHAAQHWRSAAIDADGCPR